MKLVKSSCVRFNFLILFIYIFLFLGVGPVNIYQPLTLKMDGSGLTTVSYNTYDSNLVKTKIIGNFPFTENEATAYFTSSNTEVKKVAPYENPEIKASYMVLDVEFKDINKISEAKGFSDIKASWTETDSGMAFKWTILKNGLQNNLIGEFLYIFSFSGKIISSNGIAYGDTVKWIITPKTYDYTNDIVLTAVISTGKDSSCGIFGLEFPLILIGGFVFSYGYKKRAKKEFPFFSTYKNDS